MGKHGNRNPKGLEKTAGDLGSHKALEKRIEQETPTQQAGDVAESESQGLSTAITPATHQSRAADQGQQSTSRSERSLIMMSPYRSRKQDGKEDSLPKVVFSKDLLVQMDHNTHHLEIDLFRPESEQKVFPLDDLSPLCLYGELRSLRITGMMQSYQFYIWLAVWLNPQMTDLILEMEGEAEPFDVQAIAKAQEDAKWRRTMQQVVQGKSATEVPRKFQIVNLSLTNFVVYDTPFYWFSDSKLKNVQLHRCKDANFELPSVMERSFNIIVTA